MVYTCPVSNEQFDVPIWIQIRDELAVLMETNLAVVGGKTILKEIPDRLAGVVITDGAVTLTEIRDPNIQLADEEYRVDYNVGWIYLNNTFYPDGSQLDRIDYSGRGVLLYPIERIITKEGTLASLGIMDIYDDGNFVVGNIGILDFRENVEVVVNPADPHRVIINVDPDAGFGGAFIDLNDVPSTYNGFGGNITIVNSAEDALEYRDWIDQSVKQGAIPNFGGIDLGYDLVDDEGLFVYDPVRRGIILELGNNVSQTVGSEIYLEEPLKNREASIMANGVPVYIFGATGGEIDIMLAYNSVHQIAQKAIGVTTEDIAINGSGKVVTQGIVKGIDTTGAPYGEVWNDGDQIFLGSTPGSLTIVDPDAPTDRVFIGIVQRAHALVGELNIKIRQIPYLSHLSDVDASNEQIGDVIYRVAGDKWQNAASAELFVDRALVNGSFRETIDAIVNGSTGNVELQADGGGDLTAQFSDGNTIIDCTPVCTASITFGTATVPQANFVYIDKVTKLLTVDINGWPATEHIRVCYLSLLDQAFVIAQGALINQNWNDHLNGDDGMGHMLHMTQWIRRQGARWDSGLDGVGSDGYVDIVGGTSGYIQFNAGVISQLHLHQFGAKDTTPITGLDDFHIVNDEVAAYVTETDLGNILTDANGVSMSNRYYNIILWAAANKSGTHDPIFINKPLGSYTNLNDALGDVSRYDVFTMPDEYTKDSGTGFLIARITLRRQANATLTVHDTQDLRRSSAGMIMSSGGINGSITVFGDNQLKVYSAADATKEMVFDISNVTTGNTRTLIMADKDIDLGDMDTRIETIEDEILIESKSTVPYNGAIGTFGISKDGTPVAVYGVNASLLKNYYGRDLTQLLLFGDMRQDTNLDGLSDGLLLANGIDVKSLETDSIVGQYSQLISSTTITTAYVTNRYTLYPIKINSGDNIYVSFWVKSASKPLVSNRIVLARTNSQLDTFAAYNHDATDEWVKHSFMGTAGAINDLVISLYSGFNDGTDNEIMYDDVQIYVMPSDITTVPEMEALLTGEYFEGLDWVGKPRILDQLLDNRNDMDVYSLTGNTVIDTNISQDGLAYCKFTGATSDARLIQNGLTLTPSTGYTALLHVIKNTLDIQGIVVGGTSGDDFVDTHVIPPNDTGIFKFNMTTNPTIVNDSEFTIVNSVANTAGESYFRVVLVEGDYTHLTDKQALEIIKNQDFGEFEVKGVNVKSVGKNKFNRITDWRHGFSLSTATGLETVSDAILTIFDNVTTLVTNGAFEGVATDFIDADENEPITITMKKISGLDDANPYFSGGILCYDSNKNYIGFVNSNITFTTTGGRTGTTQTTLSGTRFIRLRLLNGTATTSSFEELQIESGTITPASTDHAPYIEAPLHIDGELHGIGGVADDLDTQRFGYDYNNVVQSTINWSAGFELTDTISYNVIVNLNTQQPPASNFEALVALRIGSTIYPINNVTAMTSEDTENVGISGSSGALWIRILKSRLGGITSSDLETYLQANDVEFIYELETYLPRTEANNNEIPVEGQLITEAQGTFTQVGGSVIDYFTTEIPLNLKAQLALNIGVDIEQGKDIYALQNGYLDARYILEGSAVSNSQLLEGQNGAYYLDYNNFSNTPSFDNYGSWSLQANGVSPTPISSGETVNFVNGTNVSIVRSGNDITISSPNTNDIDYINASTFVGGTLSLTGVGNAGTSISLDGRYLLIGGKAADSNLLDGEDGSSYLRSDADDIMNNKLTMRDILFMDSITTSASRSQPISFEYYPVTTPVIKDLDVDPSGDLQFDGACVFTEDKLPPAPSGTWEVLKTFAVGTLLDQVVNGTSGGSITGLSSALVDGDVIAVEINNDSNRTSLLKVLMFTVDDVSTSPGGGVPESTGWVSGSATTLTFFSVSISGSGTALYFDNGKTTNSAAMSGELDATLYAGRVWRLV